MGASLGEIQIDPASFVDVKHLLEGNVPPASLAKNIDGHAIRPEFIKVPSSISGPDRPEKSHIVPFLQVRPVDVNGDPRIRYRPYDSRSQLAIPRLYRNGVSHAVIEIGNPVL